MGDNLIERERREKKNLGKNKLKTKRNMGRNIENMSREYLNGNKNQNEYYNGNVPEIQSLLDYFSKFRQNKLQYGRDFENLDYFIDYLISAFPMFIEFFDRNNSSKKFIDDKKKIFKNLNEILKKKIEQLNLEIDKNIRQKEKINSIISYINYKSNIPPVTMNQFLPLNNTTEWPMLGTNVFSNKKSKRKQ
jgi:hypothetical protein